MVTKGRPDRRARKRAETRDRILRAAARVVARRGFEAATVEEVAAAADVAKGTIYNHFETKEDIVLAFLADVERGVQREVDRLLDRGGPLEEVLERFVLLQLELKEPHLGFVRVFLAQMFTRTNALMPLLQELQTVVDPPLERLFGELRARGAISPDADLPLLIRVWKTLQLGLTSLWAVEGPPWEGTRAVVREQIRLFCRGLARRSE